ncbi:MAG: dihydroneopterin aldolase [Clostridia bacterium]|nr:dihydroneopterin aldolase [Clostridia bacterium]
MDKIIIKGLEIFAFHGVHAFEKENGQPFILDAELTVDLSAAARSDALGDTVSYSEIIKTVTDAFTLDKYDLIERAAGAVIDAVLRAYPAVKKITVTVKKPEAPIDAKFQYVAVQITGEAEEMR